MLIRSFQLHCKFKHKEGFQTFGTECILSNSRLLSIICRLEGCFPLYFLQLEFYTVRLFFHERRCSSLLPFSPHHSVGVMDVKEEVLTLVVLQKGISKNKKKSPIYFFCTLFPTLMFYCFKNTIWSPKWPAVDLFQ